MARRTLIEDVVFIAKKGELHTADASLRGNRVIIHKADSSLELLCSWCRD
jgi:hypothetical protein